MHKNKLEEFLRGNVNFEDIQETNSESENTGDFIQCYKKLIAESNAKVPDFDPFEKVNEFKQKRLFTNRKILLYAASVLIVVSLFFVHKNYQQQQPEIVLSDQELMEIQQNTTQALLLFSKELNACMLKFEDAKQLQQPANEMRRLKVLKSEKINK